jgi:hypothetical protein
MASHRRKDAAAPLSQRELDILKVLAPVLEGQRTQVEAARLLGITPRHVRRLLDKIRRGGAAAVAHGLRGRPSNRRADAGLRRRGLSAATPRRGRETGAARRGPAAGPRPGGDDRVRVGPVALA